MGLLKKSGKAKSNIDRDMLWNMIKDNKIPILTLDARWNTLFEVERKNPEIKKLVNRLNSLLKEQGGAVNNIKDMKKLKKKIMLNIVDNMESSGTVKDDRLRDKRQNANQKMITDLNTKLADAEDRLMELPYEIMKVNQELMLESMILCYQRLNAQTAASREIEEWINQITLELEEKRKQKEEIDRQANQIYSFMHDMLGGKVIEVFDQTLAHKD